MIKFFRRKRKPKKTIEEVLECITEDTLSEEDRKDEHKVQHYVLGHCEQMIDTTKTLENEKSEYRVVTSYFSTVQKSNGMIHVHFCPLDFSCIILIPVQHKESTGCRSYHQNRK